GDAHVPRTSDPVWVISSRTCSVEVFDDAIVPSHVPATFLVVPADADTRAVAVRGRPGGDGPRRGGISGARRTADGDRENYREAHLHPLEMRSFVQASPPPRRWEPSRMDGPQAATPPPARERSRRGGLCF